MNHSKETWKLGNELDHLGIVLVIWSSTIGSDFFGFYCDPILRVSYCAIVKRLPSIEIADDINMA